MSTAATARWKRCEKQWEEILCKFKMPAKRRTRAGNFAQSVDDVGIEGQEWIISDTKYSIHSWKENRLLAETEAKYCKEVGDSAILITKGYKEVGQVASTDAEFMAMLLAYWCGKGTKEELWEIYTK